MFADKTILVTGATGLIGSHIVNELMKYSGTRVIALGRSFEKLKKGFSKYDLSNNFQILEHNISSPLELEENIDYIFHAAGPMEGKIIANQPVDVIVPNLTGTINCLELLKRQKEEKGLQGRFILFSSVTVYGNITEEDLIVSENDTRIADFLESKSACYSQSKRMSEVIASAYHKQYDLDVVIARFSTVFGNTYFRPDTAFFEFLNKSMTGEPILLNSNNMARRDNIYIDDAVEGVLIIAKKGISGEAYNISSGGEKNNFASVDEIAKIMADISNKRYGRGNNGTKISYRTESKGERNPGIILDNRKLKMLGWELRFSLEEGVERTFCDAERV